jgi:3-oxoacyl-[acyl-carrier protein] reductase
MSGGALSGQIALVTGASQGIGRAIALHFAEAGAHVVVNYWAGDSADRRQEANAQAVLDEISANGGVATRIEADVSNVDDVTKMVERVISSHGRVDVLVNNAGILPPFAPVADLPLDEWHRVLAVNLTGPFLCCKAVLPHMLSAGRGKIITISSELAFVGRAELAHYCASKAGLIAFTKSLAREVGPKGIQVNAIAPGPTDTPMTGPRARTPEALAKLPLRRLGQPEDIARTALFLASTGGDWYAGQVLSPNGGAVM